MTPPDSDGLSHFISLPDADVSSSQEKLTTMAAEDLSGLNVPDTIQMEQTEPNHAFTTLLTSDITLVPQLPQTQPTNQTKLSASKDKLPASEQTHVQDLPNAWGWA